jgi:anti-sigma factor RsiW
MTHADPRDLLADYALGLLDDDEAVEVKRYLDSHPEAAEELRTYGEAAEALALGAEPVEQPAGLADRIRAGVAARLSEEPEAGASEPPAPTQIADRRRQEPPMPWRTYALGAAAAVLLLAIGLGASTIAWLNARDDASRLERQLASRPLELPLSGDGARGVIFVAANFEHGVAVFQDLGPAPAQHYYRVWSEGPEGFRPATDFEGRAGEIYVELPALPRNMTRMFVTIEPDGVDPTTPTGPVVMSTP